MSVFETSRSDCLRHNLHAIGGLRQKGFESGGCFRLHQELRCPQPLDLAGMSDTPPCGTKADSRLT
jgi:hypothetical protein